MYIVDNGSTDDTMTLLKKELENFPVEYKLIENKENLGFAPAHNQAFTDTDNEYFLLLNHDMYLQSDCLEKMVKFLDENKGAVAVSPRLMKWDFKAVERGSSAEFTLSEVAGLGMTNVIDALGLKIFRNRRVIEQYTQYDWEDLKNLFCHSHENGNPENKKDPRFHGDDRGIGGGNDNDDAVLSLEVFGVSGAFPMFRRSSIQSVLFNSGEFLDGSYHSYKEDVDLAYRLRAVGLKSYVLLDTVAYHDRGGAGPKEMSDLVAAENKRKQSPWVQYHSYKNHLRTLYKNEYWQNSVLDFPWILWYELKKFVYFLLFDRKVLAGLKEVWQGRVDLKNKRLQINRMKKADYKSLRKWWK